MVDHPFAIHEIDGLILPGVWVVLGRVFHIKNVSIYGFCGEPDKPKSFCPKSIFVGKNLTALLFRLPKKDEIPLLDCSIEGGLSRIVGNVIKTVGTMKDHGIGTSKTLSPPVPGLGLKLISPLGRSEDAPSEAHSGWNPPNAPRPKEIGAKSFLGSPPKLIFGGPPLSPTAERDV